MKDRTEVVITSGYRWSYFQWFLLGFYQLEEKEKIDLKFKLPLSSFLLTKLSNDFSIRVADKLRRAFEKDSYNMDGYIVYRENGKKVKKTFSIDSADAPYLFDKEKLDKSNVYFKMQCPLDLDKDGFALTERIVIPWLDHNHVDKNLKLTDRGARRAIRIDKEKIKPLMLGPRQLSRGNSYQKLQRGYNNYIKEQEKNKSKKLMCYFGNALGPKVEKNPIPDFDWEGDIMGYFKDEISHPNEKRAKVAEIISKIDDCDARVISNKNADSRIVERAELIIPLDRFCKHIAQFKWNVNVSGYRMSIPNRFIESFMVGTGIVTDKLAVKWYKPFNEEVYETVPMGYLPMSQVDWSKFEFDMKHLPRLNSEKVVEAFEGKWAPMVVAQYIIDTVKGE